MKSQQPDALSVGNPVGSTQPQLEHRKHGNNQPLPAKLPAPATSNDAASPPIKSLTVPQRQVARAPGGQEDINSLPLSDDSRNLSLSKPGQSAQAPEPKRTADPRLRQLPLISTQTDSLATDSESSFSKHVLEILAADHSYRKAKDKVWALDTELTACNEALSAAKSLPHQAYTRHLDETVDKTRRQLTSVKNDYLHARKKRDLYISDAFQKFASMQLPNADGNECNVVHQISELKQEIQLLSQQIKQADNNKESDLIKLRGTTENSQHTSDLSSIWSELKEMKKAIDLQSASYIESQAKMTGSSEISSLTSRVERLTEGFSKFTQQRFITPEYLSSYVDEFERYKKATHERLLCLEAVQVSEQNTRSVYADRSMLQPVLKDITSIQDEQRKLIEKVQEMAQRTVANHTRIGQIGSGLELLSKELSITARAKGTTEQSEAVLALSRVGELMTTVKQLGDAVARNNHTMLALSSRYNNLTSEPLLKEMMRIFNPFLGTIQGNLTGIRGIIAGLSDEQKSTKITQDQMAKAFADLRAQSIQNREQILKLEKGAESCRSSLEELIPKITENEFSDGVSELKNEISTLRESLPDIQKQLQKLEHDLSVLPGDIKDNHETCLMNNTNLISNVKTARAELDDRLKTVEKYQSSQRDEGSSRRNTPKGRNANISEEKMASPPKLAKQIAPNLTMSTKKDKRIKDARRPYVPPPLPQPTVDDYPADSDEEQEDATEIGPGVQSSATSQWRGSSNSTSAKSTPARQPVETVDLTGLEDDDDNISTPGEDYLAQWRGPVPDKDSKHFPKEQSNSVKASSPSAKKRKKLKRKRSNSEHKRNGSKKPSKVANA